MPDDPSAVAGEGHPDLPDRAQDPSKRLAGVWQHASDGMAVTRLVPLSPRTEPATKQPAPSAPPASRPSPAIVRAVATPNTTSRPFAPRSAMTS